MMALSYEDTHCERCGKEYSLAWMNRGLCEECFKKKKLEDVRQSIKEGEPDTFSSDYIICPYCGFAFEPDFEDDYLFEDGDHTYECEECDKEFTVTTMVSYSWETERMED